MLKKLHYLARYVYNPTFNLQDYKYVTIEQYLDKKNF